MSEFEIYKRETELTLNKLFQAVESLSKTITRQQEIITEHQKFIKYLLEKTNTNI